MSAPDARAADALASLGARAAAAYEKGDGYADLLFDELASLFADGLRPPYSFDDAQAAYTEAAAYTEGLPCRARLARAFAAELKKRAGRLPSPEEFLPAFPDGGRVALPDDRFSARAFGLCPRGAQKSVIESFEGACEEVSDGETDACLLPYLDENGRPLPGVAQLIDEYGLKKLSLILLSGEERSFGYALLSRALVYDRSADTLELTLFYDDPERVFDLIRLASEGGLRVSLPSALRQREIGDPTGVCSLRISGGAEELREFLFPARLLFADCLVSGFYSVKTVRI